MFWNILFSYQDHALGLPEKKKTLKPKNRKMEKEKKGRGKSREEEEEGKKAPGQ